MYLPNELCFEKVHKTIRIPVREVNLYKNRKKLLENLNWMDELR